MSGGTSGGTSDGTRTGNGDRLVYLCYGEGPIVAETEFSIVSSFRLDPEPAHEVVVYTDHPEHFAHLPVRVEPLSAETLAAWSGPDGYAHRRKLECVAHALREATGRVVFVDGDTWFRRPPRELFERVDARHALMHVRENTLRASRIDYNVELADHLSTHRFEDSTGRPYDFTADPPSWNSGVIGLLPEHAPLVREALGLLDRLQPAGLRLHTLEQFALGIALEQALTVREAIDVVYHYWQTEIRHPAAGRVQATLERTRGADLPTRARALHRVRPRAHGRRRARALLSGALAALGVRRPAVRANA
ncbi:hypothetical protein AB2L27_16695 [Kineococcus sp. LSe6-4]|uniref:Nucleotide-diphospho-sugar transferase n=1 Tax=Kineococcus halophytocola TaxID=3234027 RepID=A0ABV4H6J4_9ACTN